MPYDHLSNATKIAGYRIYLNYWRGYWQKNLGNPEPRIKQNEEKMPSKDIWTNGYSTTNKHDKSDGSQPKWTCHDRGSIGWCDGIHWGVIPRSWQCQVMTRSSQGHSKENSLFFLTWLQLYMFNWVFMVGETNLDPRVGLYRNTPKRLQGKYKG